MDADHVRLYVAMAEMFQDRTEIVTIFSEFVADKSPFRVRFGLYRHRTGTSVPGGKTDQNGAKAGITA